MQVGIIGAGAWGTALAGVAAASGNQVVLWAHDEENVVQMNKEHRNSSLPGVVIPHEIIATNNLADLVETDIWMVATPTAFFSETLQKSRPFWSRRSPKGEDGWRKQPIIICAKGIDPVEKCLLSDTVKKEIPGTNEFIGILSGPGFAPEVAAGVPTGTTIAGNAKVLEALESALSSFYYLEESDDINGVQICGAGKNAIAIYLGYLDANKVQENERGMKIGLAWQELILFGRLFHAKLETFSKLCGIGDLFLTATSKTSRNYSAGWAIGENRPVEGTVEGIAALEWIVDTAKQNKLKLPILEEFAKIVF